MIMVTGSSLVFRSKKPRLLTGRFFYVCNFANDYGRGFESRFPLFFTTSLHNYFEVFFINLFGSSTQLYVSEVGHNQSCRSEVC